MTAPSGTVFAWGSHEYGQTFVPEAAQSNVVAVAAGSVHTVALRSDGTILAWGLKIDGISSVPDSAQGRAEAIAAGEYHSLALLSNGMVVSWGSSYRGDITVPASAQMGIVAIAAGGNHSVALRGDGRVVVWGNNDFGQTDVPVAAQSGIIAIASGFYHILALRADGSVVAWGAGTADAVIRGEHHRQSRVPPAATHDVVAIAAGSTYSLAWKRDGTTVAWGTGSFPTNLPAYFVGIEGGWYHQLGLKNDGTLEAWGIYVNGRSVTLPTTVRSGVIAMAGGADHSVAVVSPHGPFLVSAPTNQTINEWQSTTFSVEAVGHPTLSYQWRRDGADIVGANSPDYHIALTRPEDAGMYSVVVSNAVGSVTSAPVVLSVKLVMPGAVVIWGAEWGWGNTSVPLAAQSGVSAIATMHLHNVALKEDGSVLVWGNGNEGETNVPPAAQSGVVAISAGEFHVAALKRDGSVVAWGAGTNTSGAGHNFGQSMVPDEARSGVVAVAAGGAHTLALKHDGTVIAWGSAHGIPPPDLRDIVAISAGSVHSLALKRDGTVVAWGNNRYGQTNIPSGLSDVRAIAAGPYDNLALRNDGSVVAWGFSCCGQTNIPEAVQGGVVGIAAGPTHMAVIKADGSMLAWGMAPFGEPKVPDGLSDVRAVSLGSSHAMALVVPSIPVVHGQSVIASECVPLPITLTATSGDNSPLTYAVERSPDHGILNGTAPNLTYTPDPHFRGLDSFSFSASNGRRWSAPTNIVITVRASLRTITAAISINTPKAIRDDIASPVVFACREAGATVVFDGSHSSSQDACGTNNVSGYSWFTSSNAISFASGAWATNTFGAGTHAVRLVVTDAAGLTASAITSFEVVPATEGIEQLIEAVVESELERRVKRELVVLLQIASTNARHERYRASRAALVAFERRVRTILTKRQSPEIASWIQWSRALQSAFQSCISHRCAKEG